MKLPCRIWFHLNRLKSFGGWWNPWYRRPAYRLGRSIYLVRRFLDGARSVDVSEATNGEISILSAVSGLPKKEVNAIWEEVKANSKTLQACSLHEFEPLDERNKRCKNCGGKANNIAVSWYERGLEHGRASK